MSDLPEINFDGKIVKPKNGFYKCPFYCSNPGYPVKKWKTEKGFRKHMEECPNSPSILKKKNEKINIEKEKFDKMKEELLSILPYKIGQKIFYVREILVKPTHVWRGDRQVKVRYDAEYDYEAREEEIKSIDVQFNGYAPNNIEYMKSDVFLNNHIELYSICSSIEEAKEKAITKLKNHKEHLEFSSRCR